MGSELIDMQARVEELTAQMEDFTRRGKIDKIYKCKSQIEELQAAIASWGTSSVKVDNHVADPSTHYHNNVHKEAALSTEEKEGMESEIINLEGELAIAVSKGKIPRIDKLEARIKELKEQLEGGVRKAAPAPVHVAHKQQHQVLTKEYAAVASFKPTASSSRSLTDGEIASLQEEMVTLESDIQVFTQRGKIPKIIKCEERINEIKAQLASGVVSTTSVKSEMQSQAAPVNTYKPIVQSSSAVHSSVTTTSASAGNGNVAPPSSQFTLKENIAFKIELEQALKVAVSKGKRERVAKLEVKIQALRELIVAMGGIADLPPRGSSLPMPHSQPAKHVSAPSSEGSVHPVRVAAAPVSLKALTSEDREALNAEIASLNEQIADFTARGKIPKIIRAEARIKEIQSQLHSGSMPSGTPVTIAAAIVTPAANKTASTLTSVTTAKSPAAPSPSVFASPAPVPHSVTHAFSPPKSVGELQSELEALRDELQVAIAKGKIPRIDKLEAKIKEVESSLAAGGARVSVDPPKFSPAAPSPTVYGDDDFGTRRDSSSKNATPVAVAPHVKSSVPAKPSPNPSASYAENGTSNNNGAYIPPPSVLLSIPAGPLSSENRSVLMAELDASRVALQEAETRVQTSKAGSRKGIPSLGKVIKRDNIANKIKDIETALETGIFVPIVSVSDSLTVSDRVAAPASVASNAIVNKARNPNMLLADPKESALPSYAKESLSIHSSTPVVKPNDRKVDVLAPSSSLHRPFSPKQKSAAPPVTTVVPPPVKKEVKMDVEVPEIRVEISEAERDALNTELAGLEAELKVQTAKGKLLKMDKIEAKIKEVKYRLAGGVVATGVSAVSADLSTPCGVPADDSSASDKAALEQELVTLAEDLKAAAANGRIKKMDKIEARMEQINNILSGVSTIGGGSVGGASSVDGMKKMMEDAEEKLESFRSQNNRFKVTLYENEVAVLSKRIKVKEFEVALEKSLKNKDLTDSSRVYKKLQKLLDSDDDAAVGVGSSGTSMKDVHKELSALISIFGPLVVSLEESKQAERSEHEAKLAARAVESSLENDVHGGSGGNGTVKRKRLDDDEGEANEGQVKKFKAGHYGCFTKEVILGLGEMVGLDKLKCGRYRIKAQQSALEFLSNSAMAISGIVAISQSKVINVEHVSSVFSSADYTTPPSPVDNPTAGRDFDPCFPLNKFTILLRETFGKLSNVTFHIDAAKLLQQITAVHILKKLRELHVDHVRSKEGTSKGEGDDMECDDEEVAMDH